MIFVPQRELFPQEIDHRLESVGRRDLEDSLLKSRCGANRLEPNFDCSTVSTCMEEKSFEALLRIL
jgi:hypothetical protein